MTVVRAPALRYRQSGGHSNLFFEKVSLKAAAERFGTPLYVYSAATIRQRLAAMERAFARTPHTICYSVKANSNLALLRMIAASGAGFDVVSGGELERVRRAAPRALRSVVFSGVGKTAAEIEAALRAKILLFNVESEAELHLLAERASRLKIQARIAVRVNPDIPAKTHPYISTGLREHKFGVPMEQAPALYEFASRQKWLQPLGVSLHIGSQISEVQPFAAAVRRAVELVRTLRRDGIDISHLDCGGGLGISYDSPAEDFGADAKRYAAAISAPLRGMDLHLLLEPGRWMVGPAGVLLTRVLLTKKNGRKNFAICDAAMNDLIRPALYGAHHEIVPVSSPTSARADVGHQQKQVPRSARNDNPGRILLRNSNRMRPMRYDVVGPICETGDFFARDRLLPELHAGDVLAVLDAGAYGMSLASNYNSRPRAAEVLVEGARARLIRRRERLADLLSTEV